MPIVSRPMCGGSNRPISDAGLSAPPPARGRDAWRPLAEHVRGDVAASRDLGRDPQPQHLAGCCATIRACRSADAKERLVLRLLATPSPAGPIH